MKTLPTADEFLDNYRNIGPGESEYSFVHDALRKFAKLHVTVALKAASDAGSDLIDWDDCNSPVYAVYDRAITHSYPLENIK